MHFFEAVNLFLFCGTPAASRAADTGSAAAAAAAAAEDMVLLLLF